MKNITKSVGILLSVLSLVACDNTTSAKPYSNPFTSKTIADYGTQITREQATEAFNNLGNYPKKSIPDKITHYYNYFRDSRVEREAEFDADYPELTGDSNKQTIEIDKEKLFYHYSFESKDYKYTSSGEGNGSYIHHYHKHVKEDYWTYYTDGYLQYAHYYFENVENNTQSLLKSAKAWKWKVPAKRDDLKNNSQFNTIRFAWYFLDGIGFNAFDNFINRYSDSYSTAYSIKNPTEIEPKTNISMYYSKGNGNLAVYNHVRRDISTDNISSIPQKENDLSKIEYSQYYINEIVDYFSAQETFDITGRTLDSQGNLIRTETLYTIDTVIEECEFEYPNLSEYTETDGDWKNPMDDGEKK